MKKSVLALLFFMLLTSGYAQKGYEIKINFKNCKDTVAYLAFYQFDKTYIADTCKKVVKGKIIFKGKKNLEKGVYALVSEKKTIYFDFFVDNQSQNLDINTDIADVIKNLNYPNSIQNQNFVGYTQFIATRNVLFEDFRKQTQGMNKADSTALMKTKIKFLNESITDFEQKFVAQNKGTFVGDAVNLKTEKLATDIPKASNGRPDSIFVYKYYKKHFWDGVNFQDDGLMRTPYFAGRVKNYFDNIVVKHPDSIAVEIDRMMARTTTGTKMNMLLLAYFTSTYEVTKIMGFDAVFIHIIDTYFRTGKAKDIYDNQTIKNIIKRGDVLTPLLLGKTAPDLFMIDAKDHEKFAKMGFDDAKTSEVATKLYYDNLPEIEKSYLKLSAIKADYLVLAFWDVDCSHCMVEIPKLLEEYHKLLSANKDVKVYAVYTQNDYGKYSKYIADKKLDWINVYDAVHINNLKDKYDIVSTPILYILDRDKKIKAKLIGVEQVKEFIGHMETEYKEAKK